MAQYELCDRALQEIRRGIPSDKGDIARYLQDIYLKFQENPCFLEVANEIRTILTTQCQPLDFSLFCEGIEQPDLFIKPLLSDIFDLQKARDYESAANMIKYLLPYGLTIWPAAQEGQEVLSFRDLIEYTYYMIVCEPKEEVIIQPFMRTDILYHYGMILSGMRKDEQALEILQRARKQSPVHAGILNEIVEIQLKLNRVNISNNVEVFLSRSFQCAWMKEELAHAYRNQGRLLIIKKDYEGAVACFLMGETWDYSPTGCEELRFIADSCGHEFNNEYYNTHGKEILARRNIPVGPDPDIIVLLTSIADDYLEEHNLFKAREYLFRAHQLVMSDEINEKIWHIERMIEDTIDF